METSGREVLATGAGTGMGLAAAGLFSSRGGRVIMVARQENRLRAAAQGLAGAVVFQCDIAAAGDVERLLSFVAAEHPALAPRRVSPSHRRSFFSSSSSCRRVPGC
jgi:uncharacterized oxidoreductase